MCVNGLEEAEGDPHVDGEDVEVTEEIAVQQGSSNRARSENEDFSGVSVLSGETEGCRVLVVDLVDVLVKRSPMQSLVRYKSK